MGFFLYLAAKQNPRCALGTLFSFYAPSRLPVRDRGKKWKSVAPLPFMMEGYRGAFA